MGDKLARRRTKSRGQLIRFRDKLQYHFIVKGHDPDLFDHAEKQFGVAASKVDDDTGKRVNTAGVFVSIKCQYQNGFVETEFSFQNKQDAGYFEMMIPPGTEYKYWEGKPDPKTQIVD